MTRKILATLMILLAATQAAMADAEMADTMRSNGKIYVVIVVLATIFAGIIFYMVYLDRKISKLEKNK